MTLSNRIRCFVEMAIMMLAVAAPSFAQISAHGYLSDCDQTKALPDYANDLKSTPRSSLASYCIAEFHLENHDYQASVNAYRDSLAGDGNPVWTKVYGPQISDRAPGTVCQWRTTVKQRGLHARTADADVLRREEWPLQH